MEESKELSPVMKLRARDLDLEPNSSGLSAFTPSFMGEESEVF